MSLSTYVDEIVASGFPGLRGLPDWAVEDQLEGYVNRIIERDVVLADVIRHRL